MALGLEDLFSGTISGEDVQRGKPAPDIFLKAAEATRTPPHKCLVFEDAPAGIAAAHAAGMRVLAVQTSHTTEEVAAADFLALDFSTLSPEGVQANWTPLPA